MPSNLKEKKYTLAIAGTTLILIFATTVIPMITTDSTFARNEGYGSDIDQAASVSNSCLNPIFDPNTIDNVIGAANCGGTVSQQGESGQASTTITNNLTRQQIVAFESQQSAQLDEICDQARRIAEIPDPERLADMLNRIKQALLEIGVHAQAVGKLLGRAFQTDKSIICNQKLI